MTDDDFWWTQRALALVLLAICLYPTVRYLARREQGLPTMAMFGGAYGIQFGLPVFLRDQSIALVGGTKYLGGSEVVSALLLAIAGICALQVGAFMFPRTFLSRMVPSISLTLDKRRAVVYCILVVVLVPLLLAVKEAIPDEYQRQVSGVLRFVENQILVVIGILGWIVFSGKGSTVYTISLYVLVGIAVIRGISTGMLEGALVPIAVLFSVRWLYARRLGSALAITAIVLFVFLSPVKSEYRTRFWYGSDFDTQQTTVAMVVEWFEDAGRYWIDTFNGRRNIDDATSAATGRADLVHQVAHIYSLTPSQLPYQYGATYSYLGVALVPRALWPDKPEAGETNRAFAVEYGITTEEGARISTFGVSLLGEAYINFGWLGVLGIMLLQGLILGLLQHTFGEERSGPGGQVVFVAFVVFALNGIGQSAEMVFGNILQNVVVGCLVLWVAREKSPPEQRPLSGHEDLSGAVVRRRG